MNCGFLVAHAFELQESRQVEITKELSRHENIERTALNFRLSNFDLNLQLAKLPPLRPGFKRLYVGKSEAMNWSRFIIEPQNLTDNIFTAMIYSGPRGGISVFEIPMSVYEEQFFRARDDRRGVGEFPGHRFTIDTGMMIALPKQGIYKLSLVDSAFIGTIPHDVASIVVGRAYNTFLNQGPTGIDVSLRLLLLDHFIADQADTTAMVPTTFPVSAKLKED